MDGLMLTLFNHICIHVRIVRVHLFFDSEIFFAIKIAETNLSKFFLVFFIPLCSAGSDFFTLSTTFTSVGPRGKGLHRATDTPEHGQE